jgi:hypothetical protein
VNTPLVEVGPGRYVAAGSVPVGGDWKAIILLARGSQLAAAPVAMPAEPDQQLDSIPLLPKRTAPLASADLLLLRENAGGSPLVAIIAYALFGATLLTWVGVLVLGVQRAARLRSNTARSASLNSANVIWRNDVPGASSAERAAPTAIGAASSMGKP